MAGQTADYTIDLSLAEQNDAQFAQEVLTLINEHRASIGIDVINIGTQFSSAYAVEHTNYMIDMSQINHDHFGVRSAALQSTGAYQVGENVAYGYSTPEAVVSAWLNSPSHRDNIEGNYTHTGFGIKRCTESNTYYFTQLFYKV
jgi:uncharacterized protein YkwD